MNSNEINERIAFLQLQRSALIDTQTIFQILIDKEICTLDEIVEKCHDVTQSNPDVARIDKEIALLKGDDSFTQCNPALDKAYLIAKLKDILK